MFLFLIALASVIMGLYPEFFNFGVNVLSDHRRFQCKLLYIKAGVSEERVEIY